MKRQSFYAAAVSCVALAMVVVLTPVAGASTGSLALRGSSASLTSPVALRGRVVDANGRAVAGAQVRLYAWPGSWQATRPGEQVPTRMVGQAVSSATGQYAVRVAVAALRASAISGGIVNLQANVVGATGTAAFYPFSVRIGPVRTGSARSVITRYPAGGSTASAAQWVFRLSASSARLAEHPGDFCFVRHTKFIKNYKQEWGTVDQTYLNRRGVQAQANLVMGQSTTFSVGISGSGTPGTFSSNGTFTFKDSIGFKFQWYSGPSSEDYQVNFRPGEYLEFWTPGHCTSDKFTQPDKQLAGHRVISAGKIPVARHCDPEPPGTLTMTRSRAATISAALTVAEIGFKVSAQTGWSETDTISYKSKLRKWWFCGVNDDPAGSPGRIVAGNRP